MHIIMVVPTWGNRCGIFNYSRSLIGGLGALGCELTVVPGDELRMSFTTGDIKPSLVHFQHGYNLYDPGKLGRLLGTLRRSGVSSIATVHEVSPAFPYCNRVLGDFDGLIVHSEAMAAELIRLGIRGELLHLIPMGCSIYRLEDRSRMRSELGLAREPAVGFFGFMLPHKGIKELLRAIALLRRDLPDLRCFIFSAIAPYRSSRGYREEVERTVEIYGLHDAVQIREEYLEEEVLVNFLHAMDVNVLPYRERGAVGASAAVRSLMAAKRPIITTNVSFFSELGEEVYKIPSGEPERIVEAVSYLLSEPGVGERLVNAAWGYLLDNTWDRVAERHLEVYSLFGVR